MLRAVVAAVTVAAAAEVREGSWNTLALHAESCLMVVCDALSLSLSFESACHPLDMFLCFERPCVCFRSSLPSGFQPRPLSFQRQKQRAEDGMPTRSSEPADASWSPQAGAGHWSVGKDRVLDLHGEEEKLDVRLL